MFRRAVVKRRILSKPVPFPRFVALQRRCYSERTRSEPRPRNRLFDIVVSFVAGASIYFFLPDPKYRAPAIDDLSLSPARFTPTTVLSNEDAGPNTKLLKVLVPEHLLPSKDSAPPFAPIWSVFIKDDDIQVERPYTPIFGLEEGGAMTFWIKRYPGGEVGKWLQSKRRRNVIELRGPTRTWSWKEDAWDEVVMISGGTGITPFAQLFNTLISKQSSENNTKFTLIHGSRTPAELPPSIILEPMLTFAEKYPEKFNLHLFVDAQDGSAPPVPVPRILTGRVAEDSLKECLGEQKPTSRWRWRTTASESLNAAPKRRMYLVCGPEGMISAVAGPYGRNLSQGPVGGILQNLGVTKDQVYKL